MLGARCPVEWQEKVRGIAEASGKKEAEIVREAIAAYLGKTDPSAVKGVIASLEDRVTSLERRLAELGRLVG
jgi:RHH-type rel operon transcriptional repressor/antitoxin RelB